MEKLRFCFLIDPLLIPKIMLRLFIGAIIFFLFLSNTFSQDKPDSIHTALQKYYLEGRFQEGLQACQRLLTDTHHPPQVLAYIKMQEGLYLKDADQFKASYVAIDSARKVLVRALDTNTVFYCELLGHCSYLAAAVVRWDESEMLAKRSLALAESLVGKNHGLYALALFHVGYINHHRRNYAVADPYFQEALQMQVRLLVKEHRDYAQTLQILGSFNMNQSKWAQAKAYFEEALNLRLQIFPSNHPRIISIYMSLGIIHAQKGELEQAEILFKKSIQAATSLQDYGLFAQYLAIFNLMHSYISFGRINEVQELVIKILPLVERLQGKNHSDYPMNLQVLALTYQKQNKFTEAEKLMLEVLELRKKILGSNHPHYGESLGSLGSLYLTSRQWDKAVNLFAEATHTMEKIQGKSHPDYGQNLFDWGIALYQSGSKAEGLSKAQEAYELLKGIYGSEHLSLVRIEYRLAEILKMEGQNQAVKALIKQSSSVQQKLLLRATTYLPENDLETYTYEFSQDLARQFTLLAPLTAQASWEDQDGLYYDGLLFYKGFVAQQVFQLRNFIRSQADTSLQAKLNHWQQLQRQIGQEYAKSINSRSANVQELEASAAELEKELVQNARAFAQLRQEVHWSDIQKHLKPKEAAIEFFLYQTKDGAERSYAAAILRPGWDNPKVVQLGTSTALDQALGLTLQSWLKGQRGIEPVKADFSRTIYELIWQPLDVLLQDVKTIYYSPIGGLNTLPLHAIPTGKGKQLLMHRYQLVLMNSTRTLVDPVADQMDKIKSAVLLGGVNYDQSTNNKSIPQTTNGAHLRSQMVLQSVPNWQDVSWGNLPGAATEVVEIEGLLKKQGVKTTLLMDSSATEGQIKSLLTKVKLAPDLIHLATHGFAFRDTLQRTGLHYSILHNPLLRTGLVLAGANQHQANDAGAVEDGILTAFEIKGFSLQGTQLVVLSACDSGLGEVRGEEGVFGLPRAFKMAGARNLLVSLWAAKDAETAQFMSYFYRSWIKGQSIRVAFWQTRAKMQKKYRDPRIWAGFVLWE